jgi:hypothetical protein
VLGRWSGAGTAPRKNARRISYSKRGNPHGPQRAGQPHCSAMQRRRKREERPEGLPSPTQKPNPSATLYLSGHQFLPALLDRSCYTVPWNFNADNSVKFTDVARTERREFYASLESRPRSGETRLQEAASTGACRQSSSSPPRAQRRCRAIAITAIGAHGHRSAKHRIIADRGSAVVTSSVGDDLGRGSVGFGGVTAPRRSPG